MRGWDVSCGGSIHLSAKSTTKTGLQPKPESCVPSTARETSNPGVCYRREESKLTSVISTGVVEQWSQEAIITALCDEVDTRANVAQRWISVAKMDHKYNRRKKKMDIACRETRHFIGLPGEVGSTAHRDFWEDVFPAALDSLQTGFKW